jgi:hypothetical protein
MCYVPWDARSIWNRCLILIVTAKYNSGTETTNVWNTTVTNLTVQFRCNIRAIGTIAGKKHWTLDLFSTFIVLNCFYLFMPTVNGCAYLIYFCMDINKYYCLNASNVWGVLCKKWEADDVEGHTNVFQCELCRDKGTPSRCRGLFKQCPQVVSTPAAWRYRTLHLNSNLIGSGCCCLIRGYPQLERSLSLLLGYECCFRIVTQSMLACFWFSVFSSQCWTRAVDQVKLIKTSDFSFFV